MSAHHQKVESLFNEALQYAPGQRSAFLAGACGNDAELRRQLEELLKAEAAAGDFLPEVPQEAVSLRLADTPDEAVGQRIGRYKLLQQIGEGGCGVVYVAEQTEPVRRRVALKVIKLGMDTKQVVARFEAERQALAMMDHPNIARVLDAGATDVGRPFFVMELVRGIPITHYCDQNNLATRERLDLFIKVCQAIQHAHQKGIIHRDIKPSNILVTLSDGAPVPKVIDFGIAKATEGRLTDNTVYTQLHQFIGTPAYMSPEQAEMTCMDIDTRSDIYSLGVLLYELLSGRTPFDARELMAAGLDAMRKVIREQEPARPSTRLATLKGDELSTTAKRRSTEAPKLMFQIEGDLDWIVMKAIEKDRTRRYETANAFSQDIARFLNDEPVTASPPSAGYQFKKFARRHKAAFRIAALIAVLLVTATLVSSWQAVRATKAEREQRVLHASAEAARESESVQRHLAEEARANETKLRKLAQLQAYAADMKAAQAALQQNSRQQAVTLLNQYWPKTGEPDLRGIEWRYLWQAAKGDEIFTWKHPGMVPGALFSPDGKQLTTACFDGMLRIWNVASGKLVTQFNHGVLDESLRMYFCYAPDGLTLATASREGIVLLDCATWQVKRMLELPAVEGAREGYNLIWSPDGQWLAASSRVGTRVWNTQSWESFALPVGAYYRAAFSPDSKQLAVTLSSGLIRLYEIATRTEAVTFSGETPASIVQFSPQGDQLVSASTSGLVALWDVRSAKRIWSQRAHRSRIFGLAFSHDGKRFASGGYDQLIHIWDAATQEKVMTLQGHLNEIWSLEFSPDDRYLLTSSKDGTVKLWDAQTKPQPHHWLLDRGEWPVGFTPDGRGLISISGDGTAVRHWAGSQVMKTLPCAIPFDRDKTVFSPESQCLYALRPGGEVQVYEAGTMKEKRTFKIAETGGLLFHVSPDQRWLAGSVKAEGEIRLWDIASDEAVTLIKKTDDDETNSRDLAAFSPDSRLLALAVGKWEVKLWDIARRQFVRTLPAHPWRVYAISFSHDGKYLASSSWEGDVRIFEVATGKEMIAPLYGHGSGVHGHSFSPDGATLVSGGDDLSVRFWNLATGREMLVFPNAGGQLARLPFLSPTGELAVWRDYAQDNRVRVETIPTMAEIEMMNAAGGAVR